MKVINMKNVSVLLDSRFILRDINWEVNFGEHWAVIGLNGSGKTTLLNTVTGYLWASKGEMSALGKQFSRYDIRELRKKSGVGESISSGKVLCERNVGGDSAERKICNDWVI